MNETMTEAQATRVGASELRQTLKAIMPATMGKRSALEILKCVKMEVSDEAGKSVLVIEAANLDVAAQARIPATSGVRWSACIPARALADALHGAKGDAMLSFEASAAKLSIVTSLGTTVLSTLPAADFPAFPAPVADGGVLDAPGSELADALDIVLKGAAKIDARPILASIALDKDANGNLLLVSTDLFRLHLAPVAVPSPFGARDACLPIPFAKMVKSLAGTGDESVRLFVSRAMSAAWATAGNMTVRSSLVEGNFPDFRSVIPKPTSAAARIVVRACDMQPVGAAAAKVVKESDKTNAVILSAWTPEQSRIVETYGWAAWMSRTWEPMRPSGGERAPTDLPGASGALRVWGRDARLAVGAIVSGDPRATVAIDYRYLEDALTCFSADDTVVIAVGSPSAPVTFSTPDATMPRCVVMPMQLSGDHDDYTIKFMAALRDDVPTVGGLPAPAPVARAPRKAKAASAPAPTPDATLLARIAELETERAALLDKVSILESSLAATRHDEAMATIAMRFAVQDREEALARVKRMEEGFRAVDRTDLLDALTTALSESLGPVTHDDVRDVVPTPVIDAAASLAARVNHGQATAFRRVLAEALVTYVVAA